MRAVLYFFCRIISWFSTQVNRANALAMKSRISHGQDFTLRAPRAVVHPENISVGNFVFINRGFFALAYGKIEIEDEVMFGPDVSLLTSGHDPMLSGVLAQQSEIIKPIRIGKGTWLGANAIVLPGVTIGENVVVGAGSVVCKDILKNSIAAGVPCRVLRQKE